jgi:hypothetical protein
MTALTSLLSVVETSSKNCFISIVSSFQIFPVKEGVDYDYYLEVLIMTFCIIIKVQSVVFSSRVRTVEEAMI